MNQSITAIAEPQSNDPIVNPPADDQNATALSLVRKFEIPLTLAAKQLLNASLLPPEFYARMRSQDLLRDARTFLAHALPKRRALWWSSLCALDVCDDRQPELAAAIDVVSRFVRQPSESHRREAERLYRKLKPTTMAAMLPFAAFCSAGSIAPVHSIQPVPAKGYVTGRLTGTVVYLAATEKDIKHYKHHMREYLTLGEQIARGENLWESSFGDEPRRIDQGEPEHAVAGHHLKGTPAEISAPANSPACHCGGVQ